MIFSIRRTDEEQTWVYKVWTYASYVFQVFGIAWIVWGGGLTIWAMATLGVAKLTAVAGLALAAALTVPPAVMFFGGGRFRKWVQRRDAALRLRHIE